MEKKQEGLDAHSLPVELIFTSESHYFCDTLYVQ